MYFDALTLAAVADELRATILGGRIQRVLLPSALSVGLEIYHQHQRHHLLASAHPQYARVHLVHGKLSRGMEQATPLLLLLRKYVLGGRVVAIEQPSLERMLFISIVKDAHSGNSETETVPETAPDLPPETAPGPPDPEALLRCELAIETMDRRSNIVLVDDTNTILESVKRVTTRMSYRVILPRQPYEVPPPQEKRDPRSATASGIAALCNQDQADLARALVGSYRGLSPQVAREALYRALGREKVATSEDFSHEAVAACLRALFADPWEPSMVPGDDAPRAFAPYRLTYLRGAQAHDSISSALEAFYGAREALTRHSQRRQAVAGQLATARERLQHQLAQIEGELARTRDVEHLRWEGEMILAFLHSLGPGQTSLEVEGRSISLDPAKTPVEQAQARFRTYQKASSGQASLQQRQQEVAARLAGAEQLAALLAVADEREQIEQIAQEADEQGYLALAQGQQEKKRKPSKQRPVRRKPLHLVSSEGYDLYVGRSATQNADVTFRLGRPDDLWLHVRTIPGAHVIIRSGGQEVPERTLQEAAGLAAYFSQARDEPVVDVDVSHRKLVRKIAGAAPGLVTYRAERTVRVAPLPPWR